MSINFQSNVGNSLTFEYICTFFFRSMREECARSERKWNGVTESLFVFSLSNFIHTHNKRNAWVFHSSSSFTSLLFLDCVFGRKKMPIVGLSRTNNRQWITRKGIIFSFCFLIQDVNLLHILNCVRTIWFGRNSSPFDSIVFDSNTDRGLNGLINSRIYATTMEQTNGKNSITAEGQLKQTIRLTHTTINSSSLFHLRDKKK